MRYLASDVHADILAWLGMPAEREAYECFKVELHSTCGGTRLGSGTLLCVLSASQY